MEPARIFKGHDGWVTAVGFSTDGDYLAATTKGALKVWSIKDF